MAELMSDLRKVSYFGIVIFFAFCLASCRSPSSQFTENVPRSSTPHVIATEKEVYLSWQHAVGRDFRIYFNQSKDSGKTFSKVRKLSSNYGSSMNPWIHLCGNEVFLVWQQGEENKNGIYFSISSNAGKDWEAPKRISSSASDSAHPVICVSGSNLFVVYQDWRDKNYDLYFVRSLDKGKTWSKEVNLTARPRGSFRPKMVVEGNKIYLVWMDNREDRMQIYFRTSDDGGESWSEEKKLTDYAGDASHPSIAKEGRNLYVVWDDTRDGNKEIYFKKSSDEGRTWSGDIRLTNADGDSADPVIVVNKMNVFVFWEDLRMGQFELFLKKSSDGGKSWSKDRRLTFAQFGSSYPSASISGNSLYLTWTDTRSGADQVYFKKSSDEGKSWSKDIQITK